MSDQEKLVDLSARGVACLLFPNKDGLSKPEITEIFSEYGNVLSVNCAGSEFGLRFVRYRTKEEAMKAVAGLTGHKSIRLTPVRGSRQKDHNEHNDQERSKQPYQEWRNGRTERADSTKGSQSSQKSNDNQRQSNQPVKNSSGYCNNNPKNTHGETSRENEPNPPRQSLNSRLNRNFQNCKDSGEKRGEIQGQNHTMNAAKLAQLHKLRGINANTFQPTSDLATTVQKPPISSAIVFSAPLLRNSTTEQSTMNELPPPLIAGVPLGSVSTSLEEERIEVGRARDIVVANIHSNIGVSNIYRLLRSCRPIYVSDIETIPDINVRFCYVYFETQTNALKAEHKFDGFSVCGQNLIALRPTRLEVESGIY